MGFIWNKWKTLSSEAEISAFCGVLLKDYNKAIFLVISAPVPKTIGCERFIFISNTTLFTEIFLFVEKTWSQSKCFAPHASSFRLSASFIIQTSILSKISILTMLWEISDLINTLTHLALVRPKWISLTHLLDGELLP